MKIYKKTEKRKKKKEKRKKKKERLQNKKVPRALIPLLVNRYTQVPNTHRRKHLPINFVYIFHQHVCACI